MRKQKYEEDKKTVSLSKPTWKKLHNVRIDGDFKNLDDTIFHALAITDMILSLAKKYNEPDIIGFTKEMVLHYEEYLRGRYRRLIR